MWRIDGLIEAFVILLALGGSFALCLFVFTIS